MTSTKTGLDKNLCRLRSRPAETAPDFSRQKGIAAVNLEESAKKLDRNRGTFYRNFEDEQELVTFLGG
ncbi:MAG: TetR/AcrR family transcriptional regulator [Planctomycetota bacterium]